MPARKAPDVPAEDEGSFIKERESLSFAGDWWCLRLRYRNRETSPRDKGKVVTGVGERPPG